jgi:septin family protein
VDFEAASDLLKNEPANDSCHSLNRLTQEIKAYKIEKSLGSGDSHLRLTLYDSPGYGSKTHADFDKWTRLITRYIKTLHVRHHNVEQAIKKEH